MEQYDMIVIGAGPGGEKAAVKAAYFGYKVAVVEKGRRVGGAGVNTGTLPSKTLKETALYFSGTNDRGLYGVDRKLTRETSIEDFMYRKNYVSTTESQEMHENLKRHGVDVYFGTAKFEDPHTVRVTGEREQVIRGEKILIACGSTPYHPPEIPFDGCRVLDSDTVLEIDHFPKSICIVGAGVIGCEYASIFATMGCHVFLINRNDQVMPFLDREVSDALLEDMRSKGVEVMFDTSVDSVEVPSCSEEPLRVPLSSEEVLNVDMFLYAAGRKGNVDDLDLEKAGIESGRRGIIKVDSEYRTNVPHIYAVGDVIGFPSLASTSMDQGRIAVANMFSIGDLQDLPALFPFGIYTIPEVSMVGITEEEAKEQGLDYCVGRAYYEDLPRGKILGATSGFMKVIFTRDDQVIRGVHVIGQIASEIVHYGVALVEHEKTLRQVVSSVFNYPTLHDLYKYACYDGLSSLSGHVVKKHASSPEWN